jgi:hypothetical protein
LRVRKAVIALIALAAGFLVHERLTFDRDAWLADYDQLRAYVSRNYANLLWVMEHRGLDPAALHHATLQELKEARTDRAAKKAIRSFVAAFQDGHFRVSGSPLSRRVEALFTSVAKTIPAGTAAEKACAALGFEDDTDGLSFDSAELQALSTPPNSFPAATFRLRDQTVGIVRISIFDTRRYLGACHRAWRSNVGERQCDAACAENFINTTVPNQLLAEFSAQVRELDRAGAKTLAVDITGNGGGTDWVEPAARIVTKAPLTCASVAFVKGPHWTKIFSELAEKIEKDRSALEAPADITLLEEAHRRALDFRARANAACDLDALWTEGGAPSCSNLADDPAYSACGLMGPLPQGSVPRAVSRGALFQGLGYSYEEGVFGGRVAVLVDGGTASAAEYFAAILADNDSATVLGQRTFGVGCGYTDGNEGVILANSGLEIVMPDCQRRRRDGTNEMAGITPDVPVDWKDGDSDAERWAKLTTGLAPLLTE